MKNARANNFSHHKLDSEKELKDLVTLCSEEIGLLLGVMQGELLFLQQSPHQNVGSKTFLDMRNVGENVLLLARNLKIFSNTSVLDSELNDLSHLLLVSIDSVEKELHAKGVRLTVLAEAGSYCKVDSSALQTAFTNLVLFIGHFLPQNSELHISLKHTENEVIIEMTEDKSLLNPHFEEQLFHPHALREEHPSLNSLCIAPSVAKFAFLNHGGSFELKTDAKVRHYTMRLPYDANVSPKLSYPKQRRVRRIKTHLRCELSGEKKTSEDPVVSIISTLGLFLKLPKNQTPPPELNQELSFLLKLNEGNKIANVRARVANMHAMDKYYGLGLEFIEVEERGKTLIEEIVRCSLV